MGVFIAFEQYLKNIDRNSLHTMKAYMYVAHCLIYRFEPKSCLVSDRFDTAS